MNVLVVMPDAEARKPLEWQLAARGWRVTPLDLGEDAQAIAGEGMADAIITALDLPDMGGEAMIRALRLAKVAAPVLVLSDDGRVARKVGALGAGADDYLTTPYHIDELAARLGAMVRRSKNLPGEVLTVGPITLDLAERRVRVGDQPIHLTRHEFALVEALMVRAERTLTKGALMTLVYGGGPEEPEPKIIDVFVCKIRNKLGPVGAGHLQTVWGQGYRMSAAQAGATPATPGEGPTSPAAKASPARVALCGQVLEALRAVAPRDMGYEALAAVVDATPGTLRRALADLQADERVIVRHSGRAFRWSVGA